jgi:glycine/D-amino acid oxidase-like deaminating enzyme/nitrite reductase/ring-hydroxylating ferredoxin subunit
MTPNMAAIATNSYWTDNTPAPRFSALKEDIAVDVLVVGAGITGITAAYLLKQAGHNVALVDKERCLSGDTTYTTAHLTCVTDTPLSTLVENFGRDHAQAAWDAQLAAIDTIDRIVWREQIKCQFEWVPGYLFNPARETGRTAEPSQSLDLEKEAELASSLGFDAKFQPSIPFYKKPGVRLENQAKFHPRKYLIALLRLLGSGKGCQIFEQTEIQQIEGTPITATTRDGHRIHCEHLLIATHVPLQGKAGLVPATVLQSKLAPYTSYVVGGWVARGTVHEALFWDTGDPYDYLRVDRKHDHDFVILGGEDHKTGQVDDPAECYERLDRRLRALIPGVEVSHRWSGQVIETNDGLPFIGETAERQFAATGYAGNGMTFGTLAGMMACDAVTGRRNPWSDLFDPGRKKIKGGLWDYLRENKDYPYYLIRDRFVGAEGRSLRELRRGEGKILELDGKRVAAFKSESGAVTLLSPICTHMGCVVAWNGTERTWDCPCHGSRFEATGKVLSGPAESPLPRV